VTPGETGYNTSLPHQPPSTKPITQRHQPGTIHVDPGPAGRQRPRAQCAKLSVLRRCGSSQPSYPALIRAGELGGERPAARPSRYYGSGLTRGGTRLAGSAKVLVRARTRAPLRNRTVDLLLTIYPRVHAVANWNDAGQVRGGPLCCRPTYLFIARTSRFMSAPPVVTLRKRAANAGR